MTSIHSLNSMSVETGAPHRPKQGRINELCKEEKEQFLKIQKVASCIFVILSPVLFTGKFIFESMQRLNAKVFSLLDSSNPALFAIQSVYKFLYAIPAYGILLATAPMMVMFNQFKDMILKEFDYLERGLIKAAQVGDLEALKILFDTNHIDKPNLIKALSVAAAHGQIKAFEFFLDYIDASKLEPDILKGFLNKAIANGHFDFIKTFVEKVGVGDYCHEAMAQVLKAEQLEAAYVLSMTDEEYLSSQKGAVLVLAAKQGDLEKVIALVSSQVGIESAASALLAAVEQGNLEIVKYLLEFDNKYVCKEDSLEKAAELGHLRIAQEILKSGEIEHAGKKRAFEKAMQNGFFEIANALTSSSF